MNDETFSGRGHDGYIAGAMLDKAFWLPVQQIVQDPIEAEKIRVKLLLEAEINPSAV